MIRNFESGPLQTFPRQPAPRVKTDRGVISFTEILITDFEQVFASRPRVPGHDVRHMLWAVGDRESPRLVEVRQMGYKPGDFRFALSLLQANRVYGSGEELWQLVTDNYKEYSQLYPLAYSELKALSEGNANGPYSWLHMRSFGQCDFVGRVGYVNPQTVIERNWELRYLSPQDWVGEWEQQSAACFFYLPPPQPELD